MLYKYTIIFLNAIEWILKMRKTKEEARITKNKILDAGAKIFSKYGYSASTLEDIATEANVTRGAIYWHFKNKAEILKILIMERLSIMYKIIDDIKEQNIDALEKLKKILITILKSIESNNKFREIMNIIIFKVEVIPEIEYQMKYKRESNKKRLKMIQDLIEEAQSEGTVEKNIDSYTIATTINCLFIGIITEWLIDPSLFSISKQVEKMLDLLLNGITK
jgi:TetR/AcrR family acrAB operon transcriptional repressor